MKNMVRIALLLLSFCMAFTLVGFAQVNAAEGATNVALSVDKTNVEIGDTVVVTITNGDFNAMGFGIYMSFDSTLLTCTGITGADGDEFLGMYYAGKRVSQWIDANVGDTVADTNKDGIFSFGVVTGNDTAFYEGVVAELTFTATASGTVTFTLNEDTVGADAFKGVAATATVVIAAAEPEHTCEHDHFENNETTHWSVCACGESIGEAVAHTGGHASCTEKAICETCQIVYGELDMTKHPEGEPSVAIPNENGTHNLKCAACGTIEEQAVNCDYAFDLENHKCVCGNLQPAGWVLIGDAWYYIDPETFATATGVVRVPYPTVAINGITYAANAVDKAYWEAHKDTSSYTDAETAMFVFDAEGKFLQTSGIINGKHYAVNGMIAWHVGLVEVDGEYYYFKGDVDGNGNVMVIGSVYASRNTTGFEMVAGGVYTFDTDGKLFKHDGITNIDGKLYYYDDYRLAIDAGLIKVDGAFYYVRSTGDKAGQLVVGRNYWVSKNNGLLASGMYTFGADGKIAINTENGELNGIVNIDGEWYFYLGGVRQVGAGVVKMIDDNGQTYFIYVRSDGRLATGNYWPTTTNGLLEADVYDWGVDGKYYPAN